jgi:hypothetical protein
MVKTGVMPARIEFEEYVDVQFAEGSKHQTAWKFDRQTKRAE